MKHPVYYKMIHGPYNIKLMPVLIILCLFYADCDGSVRASAQLMVYEAVQSTSGILPGFVCHDVCHELVLPKCARE